MVQHHQRLIVHHHLPKNGERFGEEGCYLRRLKPKILSFLLLSLLSLLSCSFFVAPHLFGFSSSFSLLDSFVRESEGLEAFKYVVAPPCSSISVGSMCCDRTGFRSDICIMRGDVRTHSPSSSLILYTDELQTRKAKKKKSDKLQHEKIRPYTRKWETSVMDTVQELNLVRKNRNSGSVHSCDVYHDVPAVFFSTGGYTGNVYHEFNDGLIPLYITSQHFNKSVVFVIVEYHDWWMMKYGDIVSELSDFEPVDFSGDKRSHCFREAIVGLRIHDELTVNSSLMQENKGIVEFRNVLDRAYWPRINGLIQEERQANERKSEDLASLSPLASNQSFKIDKKMQEDGWLNRPKLVILSRNGSRAIINEDSVVQMAEEIGFRVKVLKPEKTTEMAKIYRSLNSSDVMVGVHGAAMTHLLFMKPGSVFVQVIPLGTSWAAETYYGEPAKKLGLKYIGYEILAKESSLYEEYGKDDPVIRDPDSVTNQGWEYTKKIYLERQNVKLEMERFRKRLVYAYNYSMKRRIPSSVGI